MSDVETAADQPLVIMVDDEEDLREPTVAYLREQGLTILDADGGPALDRLMADQRPTVVVLDVTMPGEDGFSIARRLRAADPALGIVMLTARRDAIDRVVGLELGADDYIMKPFEPRELLARIRSVIRRLEAQGPARTETPPTAPAEATPPTPHGEYQSEFWIPTQRGQICVPVDQIDWIEAAKDYALLHTSERSHMIRVTMSALETGLDPKAMMRVHRSAFVRPGAVRQINAVGRHMVLVLKSGAAVRVGPRHWSDVRGRLAG